MREIVVVFALVVGWMAPAFAQKAEIEAANAKWIALFNKGDFAGVAALYTADASAFPPGSPIARGRDAIGAMWKGMAEKVGDPKLTTLGVCRPGGRARDRQVQPEDEGPEPAGGDGEVRGGLGDGWKRLAARR